MLIEVWRRHYNAIRPHGSLGYRPPAPEAIIPINLAVRLRYAPPTAQIDRYIGSSLTLRLDQSVGADHGGS